jgi:hypothetical protein
MGSFEKKVTRALKKIMGSSSSCSHESSSVHFTESEESPMHEDEETTPMEAQD